LIARGDAQTLPSERNSAATGAVWFDPILPKTDDVAVGTVIFFADGRTVWHQHAHGQLLQITSGCGFVCQQGEAPQMVLLATPSGSHPTSDTGMAPLRAP
jgi:quercetin dioxygenase-like cupin family protein